MRPPRYVAGLLPQPFSRVRNKGLYLWKSKPILLSHVCQVLSLIIDMLPRLLARLSLQDSHQCQAYFPYK